MNDWLEKLNDPSRSTYERQYRLLSAVSISLLFVWLVLAYLADGYSFRILFFGVCELLLIPITIISLRTERIQIGAGLCSIALVFFMLPFAFFFNGGIGAGAPNWCIIALVFVTMTVRGRLRTFLIVSDFVITVGCYMLSWIYPELVNTYTVASGYVDSLSSLVITGILVSIMFLFQLHITHQEKELMQRQQHEIMDLSLAQSRFFSNMSHEIRTPVNTIVGLNEMILRENVSDEVAENAGHVRAAGKLLLHLINDILDMSMLESGHIALSNEVYNVGDILSEIVGMMWLHAERKGLSFHVDVDPQIPAALKGDEMRIRQILINLLNNAIKYTQKGSVKLSVIWKQIDEGNGTLSFRISDTGRGIKKENLPFLFTAFKRVDNDKNRGIEGTGLGLAIVKQLVERMGGSVSVSSIYMKGTTFTADIPQQSSGMETVGEINLEGRHGLNVHRKYVRTFEAPEARVLVVDDNAANLLVVEKLLRDTAMTIDTASDGEQALVNTLHNRYDLIFMDHLMPGMDGVECLSRIRTQTGGLSKEAKAVALTANVEYGSRQFYARNGFDGYVTKPCSGAELESICVQLLPRKLVRLNKTDNEIIDSTISWMSPDEKKEDIIIATDSIADLPQEIIRKNEIAIIHRGVRTTDGFFKDGLEIDANGLLDYLKDRTKTAVTIAPTVEDYEAFFARQLTGANHLIYISISGKVGISGLPNAVEGAMAFSNVTVIDSVQLSSGEGLLVMEACRLRREITSPEEIVEKLNSIKHLIHTSYIVESLDFMERSGLVNSHIARFAEVMMISPVISIKDGGITIKHIFVGSRESAWKKYISRELKNKNLIDTSVLFVTYVGLSHDELDYIKEEISKRVQFDEIYFQKASPAIALNCGPGTFGLIYKEKEIAPPDLYAAVPIGL